MRTLKHLFDNNRRWAENLQAQDPEFLERLAQQQKPEYVWIGCSDSRVPANEIVGLLPGELFVHRNVANQVHHADLNSLSVLQFAIDVLGVQHVIVCGHYGCGGVAAALADARHGLVDNWLHGIVHIRDEHLEELNSLQGEARVDRLCELNVRQQVENLRRTSFIKDAWTRGQTLHLHGWIYSITDGILRDLEHTVSGT